MSVSLHAIILMMLAVIGKAQPSTRFLSTGVSANVTSVMKKAPKMGRALESIEINSWSDISSSISEQDFKWGDTDLNIYKTMALGTFNIFNDVSSGKPWDVAVLDVSKELLPVFSMVNPVLGLALGVFFSIFGSGGGGFADAIQKAFQDLYDKIMKEVKQMFIDTTIQSELRSVSQKIAETLREITLHPAYLGDINATTDCMAGQSPQACEQAWRQERLSFWMDREGEFNSLINDVFSKECVNKAADGPQANPGPICRGFQKSAAIVFQFPFAITHLQVISEIGRLALTPEDSHEWLCTAKYMAGIYSSLMKDSFNYFKTTSGEEIQCEYSYSEYCDKTKRSSCYKKAVLSGVFGSRSAAEAKARKCYTCRGTLKSVTNPLTGKRIDTRSAPFYGCRTYVSRSYSLGSSFRATDFCKTGYGGACSSGMFSAYRTEWMQDLSDTYLPMLNNVSAVSDVTIQKTCPLEASRRLIAQKVNIVV